MLDDYSKGMHAAVDQLDEYRNASRAQHPSGHLLVGIAVLVGCLCIGEAILKSSQTIADAIAASKED